MAFAPPLLYPFRFRDPRIGKWIRARYKASRSALEQRYREWEITGRGEMRESIGGSFNPHGKLIAHDDLKRLSEPPLQFHPHLEAEPTMHAAEIDPVRRDAARARATAVRQIRGTTPWPWQARNKRNFRRC